MKHVTVALMAALLLSACASIGSSGSDRRSDVITSAEMEEANVSDLYELVERLRPRWLDVRARRSFNSNTTIVVFQGQSYLGGVDMLRQLGPDAATTLRYLDGPTASATLPGLSMTQVEAAIVINPN